MLTTYTIAASTLGLYPIARGAVNTRAGYASAATSAGARSLDTQRWMLSSMITTALSLSWYFTAHR